eukprot:IDg8026t1
MRLSRLGGTFAVINPFSSIVRLYPMCKSLRKWSRELIKSTQKHRLTFRSKMRLILISVCLISIKHRQILSFVVLVVYYKRHAARNGTMANCDTMAYRRVTQEPSVFP